MGDDLGQLGAATVQLGLQPVGGPDVPAMPFATPLEHGFMEPEPDHLYRRMLQLARS